MRSDLGLGLGLGLFLALREEELGGLTVQSGAVRNANCRPAGFHPTGGCTTDSEYGCSRRDSPGLSSVVYPQSVSVKLRTHPQAVVRDVP